MHLLIFLLFNLVNAEINIDNLNVDFDQSLGKDLPFLNNFYNRYMSNKHNSKSEWNSLIRPFSGIDFLNKVREFYTKFRENILNPAKETKIPLIIHQIWIGSPFPKKYEGLQKTWKSMPGWKYILWTDKEIDEFGLENKHIYMQSKNYGQRADIARIEILNRFGGLYVDVDFECLQPKLITLLHYCYDFYAGIQPLDTKTLCVNNALIGSIKEHPILKDYIERLRKTWGKQTGSLYEQVVVRTGPGLFTKACISKINEKNNIILPPTFFYPLGFFQLDTYKRKTLEFIKSQTVRPESIAIHWWAKTWHYANIK